MEGVRTTILNTHYQYKHIHLNIIVWGFIYTLLFHNLITSIMQAVHKCGRLSTPFTYTFLWLLKSLQNHTFTSHNKSTLCILLTFSNIKLMLANIGQPEPSCNPPELN